MIIAQGVLGHHTTMSWREIIMRVGLGEGWVWCGPVGKFKQSGTLAMKGLVVCGPALPG